MKTISYSDFKVKSTSELKKSLFFLREEEGEELFYKRGFEFKLPYPCLNDFESSFVNGVQSTNSFNEISNNNNIKANLVQKNSDSNQTQKIHLPTTSQAKKANKTNNILNSVPPVLLTSLDIPFSANNTNMSAKSKSAKNSKNQERCHNKQQFQQHSQLHQFYTSQFVDGLMSNGPQANQNNFAISESNFAEMNQNLGYKFNSNYNSNSSHLETNVQQISNNNLSLDTRVNYYNQNLVKSEQVDEPNVYDSKGKFSTLSNPEFSSTVSSLSSSSVGSTASSSNSLPTLPADTSISINISNSAYHYGNYFNGLNQSSYGNSRYLHENQNKLYTGSSSSSSPFYLNSHSTTAIQSLSSQNSNCNFYNHHLGQHYNETINETNNLHSNSSCSSTSSISSNNSVNGSNSSVKNNINNLFNESGYNNNSFAAAAAGILWPKSIDSEMIGSSRTGLHSENEISPHHYHSFNHSGYETETTSHLAVNNQITVANNYSELTGAKYSCGASSNLYCQYPFVAIDDYNTSVSQI